MNPKIFRIAFGVFGGGLLLFATSYTFFGWSFSSSEKKKGVPKTIRDNPGAYRVHYIGGK